MKFKSSNQRKAVMAKLNYSQLRKRGVNIKPFKDTDKDGYTYIATENMVRVMPLPKPALMKEQQVTRIYKITYADSNDVYTALKKFVSGKAELGYNKGTNHIMVTDTEDKIKPIDKFIEQVDRMTSQVLVEVG